MPFNTTPAKTGSYINNVLTSDLMILDRVPNASAAYGLRKLRSAYAGNCIKIRRSSDSTELDIGFSGNNLDIDALLAFVGTGSGTVSTWYDQSGNGLNATSTARPILVSSGVLQKQNNRPALSFTTTQNMVAAGVTVPQPLTQYAVATPSTASFTLMVGSTSGDQAFWMEGNVVRTRSVATNLFNIALPTPLNTFNVINGVWNGSSSSVGANLGRINGTLGSDGISGLEIGSWKSGSNKFNGFLSELIIYPAAHTIAVQETVGNLLMGAFSVPEMGTHVFDGDSLTYGTKSTGGLTYPAQFMASIAGANYYINDGVPGNNLLQMDADAPTTIDNQVYAAGQPVTLAIWGGTNDIYVPGGGYTPAQTYDHLKTYITNRKATGKYSRIVVFTSIPREDDTAKRFAYNDLIRAGMQPGGSLRAAGANLLCDLQQLPMFNKASDVDNLAYYDADRIHCNNNGYAQVAAAYKATLGM